MSKEIDAAIASLNTYRTLVVPEDRMQAEELITNLSRSFR
jgi:hypothetical protein